jgi:hypothetical protein
MPVIRHFPLNLIGKTWLCQQMEGIKKIIVIGDFVTINRDRKGEDI